MENKILLLKSIQASIFAGKAILNVYHSDFTVHNKDDDSPLTLADQQSHEIIFSYLEKYRIPILSEEGKEIGFESRKTWQRFWLVDPLDGTKEFIKRNDEFTVNIALIEDGLPVLGVIFVPALNVLFFASKVVGAYKTTDPKLNDWAESDPEDASVDRRLNKLLGNSIKLNASISHNTPFTIVGSRSHAGAELQSFVEKMQQEHGKIAFISAGSSLKFCMVAEGKADLYPRLGPTHEWDTAAGQAIVEVAGAKVLEFDTKKPLFYNKKDLLNPWFVASREP